MRGSKPRSETTEKVRLDAFALRLEPVDDLGFGEEASSFDFVGGQLAAGGEAVDLLGLAAEHGGELVDSEEGR